MSTRDHVRHSVGECVECSPCPLLTEDDTGLRYMLYRNLAGDSAPLLLCAVDPKRSDLFVLPAIPNSAWIRLLTAEKAPSVNTCLTALCNVGSICLLGTSEGSLIAAEVHCVLGAESTASIKHRSIVIGVFDSKSVAHISSGVIADDLAGGSQLVVWVTAEDGVASLLPLSIIMHHLSAVELTDSDVVSTSTKLTLQMKYWSFYGQRSLRAVHPIAREPGRDLWNDLVRSEGKETSKQPLNLLTIGASPALCVYSADISLDAPVSLGALAADMVESVASAVKVFGRSLVGWFPDPVATTIKDVGRSVRTTVGEVARRRGLGDADRDEAGARQLSPPPSLHSTSCEFEFVDDGRIVSEVALDARRRLALTTDSLSRVMLIDCADLVVLRVWKGYRRATCGWFRDGVNELPVIYAPKRSSIEVWPCFHGGRCFKLRVGAGVLINQDDGLHFLGRIPHAICRGEDSKGGRWLWNCSDRHPAWRKDSDPAAHHAGDAPSAEYYGLIDVQALISSLILAQD